MKLLETTNKDNIFEHKTRAKETRNKNNKTTIRKYAS